MATIASDIFAGLMSGTSLDGVDGALCRFTENAEGHLSVETLASAALDMPSNLRTKLSALASANYAALGQEADVLEQSALAGNALSELYAQVVEQLQSACPEARITAIGAHGQTVRHKPELGLTLQILNGAKLAALSQVPCICDFRSSDLALGGQGAPLVPLFHQALLSHPSQTRWILNLGGIANLSLLPSRTSVEQTGAKAVGFDTGPASILLDTWCKQQLGADFDHEGQWAASGETDVGLLNFLLREPFFSLPTPKSTGRELFSLSWLEARLKAYQNQTAGAQLRPQDVQATLTELTAQSIVAALPKAERAATLYGCGGGVRNRYLMQRLSAAFSQKFGGQATVTTTADLGIAPQQMEACAFAWLARQRWYQRKLNYGPITGSRQAQTMGAVYLP